MSNAKLGLLVFWPTFWTAFPLKMVIGLLVLAGHPPHVGEGGWGPVIGGFLETVFIIGIPFDIWALGLCARTVFLERLSVEPPKGMGLRLWAQWAAFSVIFLPILSLIVGGVKSLAQSATHASVHFFEETFMVIPVAEKITLELVMWGLPTTLVLIAMLYGWLFGLGALTQRHVRASTPVDGTFQDIVYRWDVLRIPKDQPLLLTAFTGTGVILAFLFWGLIPVSTPHPHDEYQFINVKKVEQKIVPKKVMKNAEKVLARAEATIKELEKENSEGKKSEGDKKAGKSSEK